VGRFTSRDTWGGDANKPISFNRWEYVYGNPVNYSDPAGMCREDDEECRRKAAEIVVIFPNIEIDMGLDLGCDISLPYISKPWTKAELEKVQQGLDAIKNVVQIVGESQKLFPKMFGNVTISRVTSEFRQAGANTYLGITSSSMHIFDAASGYIPYVTIHEFGHILNYRKPGGGYWDEGLLEETKGSCNILISGSCFFGYEPGGTTSDIGKLDLDEDFAESFARTIAKFNPNIDTSGYPGDIDSNRFDYIARILFSYKE
jgi:hypothetical protein